MEFPLVHFEIDRDLASHGHWPVARLAAATAMTMVYQSPTASRSYKAMGCEGQGCTIQWEIHQIAECVLLTTVQAARIVKTLGPAPDYSRSKGPLDLGLKSETYGLSHTLINP